MSSSFTRERYMPHTARTVITYVECAIFAHRYADWQDPNLPVLCNEASQKVLIAANVVSLILMVPLNEAPFQSRRLTYGGFASDNSSYAA